MGLFSSTPEEREMKERQKAEEATRKAEAAFTASPPGQARAAKAAGATIFQIDLPLSETRGFALPVVGTFGSTDRTKNYLSQIHSIEK